MRTIEIARKLANYGQKTDACRAYSLAIQTGGEDAPAEELEAAAYILQFGGDYRISYTSFINLYNRGCFREDILPLMTKVFYEPNEKLLKSRYERNCKLLAKYPYLFRKDFPKFKDLPIRFFPYDDHSGYVPFYQAEERFGDFINFKNPVVSRNFFKDLENPVLADDVYSQYELEYLNDNVRRSEDVARENHVYLHYTNWETFCSYLQCLSLRGLLESRKLVFLIEDEISRYPIDFKEQFGIDYGQYTVQPVGIREINRMIWHTQLSTHNGGDFFNEIFDAHPNLLCLPSVMMYNIEQVVKDVREPLESASNLNEVLERFKNWGNPRMIGELYRMRNRTDKDILVAFFLHEKMAARFLDPNARIAPAVFFQPHFHNIIYDIQVDTADRAVLFAKNYEKIQQSPIFRNFKYIKAFTPMRRFTTSHGATVKFMYYSAQKREKERDEDEKKTRGVVNDAVMQRILNRSFMIDPDDKLYKDSVLVRFEDGKLNPTATFTALAAFLDLPYTKSMTYCSENGNTDYGGKMYEGYGVRIAGFDPATIYRTYDEYVNDSERYFIEYFLRDAYEFYGYDFNCYDGAEVNEERVKELLAGFTTINHYMRITWEKVFETLKITGSMVDHALKAAAEGTGATASEINAILEAEPDGSTPKATAEIRDPAIAAAIQKQLLETYMRGYDQNRLEVAKVLLKGLRFVNKNGQPLRMMPMLELDPTLLENPLYH